MENSSAHAVQSAVIAAKPKIKNVISDQRQAVIILRVYVYVRVCVCTYVCMLCYKPEGCFQSL